MTIEIVRHIVMLIVIAVAVDCAKMSGFVVGNIKRMGRGTW
jgi:hypothetical protein